MQPGENRYLNLRSLLEFNVLISSYSPNLIETRTKLSLDALQRYWSCSRAQSRLWLSRLTDFPAEIAAASPERREIVWRRMQPLLADVLAGELVSRVWGAVLSAGDCALGQSYGEPIARNVLAQHEAVRNRALQLLLDGSGLPMDEAASIDLLRRRLERWTDVLVGHLVRRYALSGFAFDLERAREFGEEQLEDSWGRGDVEAWDVYLVCLRTSFFDVTLPDGRLAELREGIAQWMLAAFPRESFLDTGPMQSVGLRRLLSGGAHDESRRTSPHRFVPDSAP
jgi:hypothetical protein